MDSDLGLDYLGWSKNTGCSFHSVSTFNGGDGIELIHQHMWCRVLSLLGLDLHPFIPLSLSRGKLCKFLFR
jgi:hypothetical protein